MKIVQFTIPVAKDHSVIIQDEKLPYFYPHLHRHKETQITWIVSGEGTLIIGNYMQPFTAGDVYIIGANQAHIFKNDPVYFQKDSQLYVKAITIFFSQEGFFQPILNLPELNEVKKFMQNTDFGLKAPVEASFLISEEILKMQKEKEGFRIATFIKLLQTFAGIKDWKVLASFSTESTFTDSEGMRMNNIYQFTMNNYVENIKLQQVADIAFLTPQAFCRYFKKHTGKTYIDFLNEIRINEACKKIFAGTYDSIASVAYDSGFKSAVSFNRVFKKIIGKSPLQYRNEYYLKTD
jgi:AraC-like DNA-binding protein